MTVKEAFKKTMIEVGELCSEIDDEKLTIMVRTYAAGWCEALNETGMSNAARDTVQENPELMSDGPFDDWRW